MSPIIKNALNMIVGKFTKPNVQLPPAKLEAPALERTPRKYVRKQTRPATIPFQPKKKWKVVQSDSIEFLKTLKPNSVQIFILDPPYNVSFDGYNSYKDNMPHEAYIHQQLMVLQYCFLALKEGGSIFYLNYPENASEIWAGATFLNRFEQMAWVYNTLCSSYPLRKGHRTWLWFAKGEPVINDGAFLGEYISVKDKRVKEKMANGDKPQHHDWLQTPQVNNTNPERRSFHPCQYPSIFAEKFIEGATKPGDLVVDVYLGSGTTGLTALKLNREFAGCDMDAYYVSEVEKLFLKLEMDLRDLSHEGESAKEIAIIVPSKNGAPEVRYQSTAPEEGFEGFVTGQQMMQGRVERPQLLIENYFGQRGIGVLAGETGSRKSFIAMDAAYAVATGTTFLGRFQAMQGGVLYCNFELSQADMQSRNEAFCRFRGLSEMPKDLVFFNRLANPFDLARPEDAVLLKQKLDELRPKFLVFDTFKRGTSINGNNDKAVTKLFGYLASLGEQYGFYTLIVDHTNKMGREVAGAYGKLTNAAIGLMVNKVDGLTSRLRVVKDPTGWSLPESARELLVSVTQRGVVSEIPCKETENAALRGSSSRQRKDALGRDVILLALAAGERTRQELLPVCSAAEVSVHRMDRLLEELVVEKAVTMTKRHGGGRGGADHVYAPMLGGAAN